MRIVLFSLFILGVATGEETLYLKSGKFQKGKLVSQSEEAVTFEFKKSGVAGISQVRIPWKSVDKIKFSSSVAQIDALANPAGTEISVFADLWKKASPWISRPESEAAAIGLAYAQRLVDTGKKESAEKALKLFEHISGTAWKPEDQVAGVRGKLRTLLKTGREKDAIREAEALAETTENPMLLLESKMVLATDAFERLKVVEADNPRWILDDEIRPVRNALFNTAIDHSLFAYLFFGSEEFAAAKGLYHAAEVYEFAKDLKNAKTCAEDILKLYPNTPSATQANTLISRIPSQSENE